MAPLGVSSAGSTNGIMPHIRDDVASRPTTPLGLSPRKCVRMRHHRRVGVLRRVWRWPRPEVVAVVAVISLLVILAALALSRVSPHRAAAVDQLGVSAVPADGTGPDAPPSAAPATTAPTQPSPSPHDSTAGAAVGPAAAPTDLPASADPTGRPASAPTDP